VFLIRVEFHFIYDVNGVLVKKFIAQQKYETFAEALRPLLPK